MVFILSCHHQYPNERHNATNNKREQKKRARKTTINTTKKWIAAEVVKIYMSKEGERKKEKSMANMLTVLRGSRSGYDIRNFKKSVRKKVFADEITRKN